MHKTIAVSVATYYFSASITTKPLKNACLRLRRANNDEFNLRSSSTNKTPMSKARFPSKRNRLRCVRCVWMETGLNMTIHCSTVSGERANAGGLWSNESNTAVVFQSTIAFSSSSSSGGVRS